MAHDRNGNIWVTTPQSVDLYKAAKNALAILDKLAALDAPEELQTNQLDGVRARLFAVLHEIEEN